MIDPDIGGQLRIAIAAFLGGLLRLLFRPADSFLKTVWLLTGCVTCGYYGTPFFLRHFAIHPDDSGAIGAALGFIGLSFAEAVLRAADSIDLRGVMQRLVKRFFP